MIKAGIIGWPVEHSLSPRLHGFWLKQYGIAGAYVKLPVEPPNLKSVLRNLQSDGFRGVNLTVPHKETALAHLDHIDDAARHLGAVNTIIVRDDGKLEGLNTDVYGFEQNIMAAHYKPGKPAVIIGAGGAARAAIAALIGMKAPEIRVINRTASRTEELIKNFGPVVRGFSPASSDDALENAGLLVNATSLGMKGQPALDMRLDRLPRDALVTDMVYMPLETDLLAKARMRGNPVADGLGMLLHQARPAFAKFFGSMPEVTDDLRRFILTPV